MTFSAFHCVASNLLKIYAFIISSKKESFFFSRICTDFHQFFNSFIRAENLINLFSQFD